MTASLRTLRQTAAVVAVSAALAVVLVKGLGPLVLVVAVLAPVGLLIAQRPQRGVLLLTALAPLSGVLVLVQEPGGPVHAWKEALILATLAATFVAPEDSRRRTKAPLPTWVQAMAALFVVALGSALLVGAGLPLTGLKIAFFYLLVPVILWRCPLSARERDRLVTILVTLGVVTAAYGLLQQVLGPDRLNQLGYEYNSAIRFSGSFLRSFSTFVQPFPFALYLMVVLLVGVPHAFQQRERLRSRVFWLTSPLLLLALATTFVRAAWLGLALGLLLLGVRRHPQLLLPVPVALVAILFLPASVSSTAFSSSSSGDRLATWSENIDDVMSHPLGFGVGTSGSAAERAAREGVEGPLLLLPDNHYFKVLYDLGVLGLWFFVLALVAVYAAVRRQAEQAEGPDAPLAWGVLAVVAAVMAASFMANVFEIFPVDLLFWTLVGVLTLGEVDELRARRPLALARG